MLLRAVPEFRSAILRTGPIRAEDRPAKRYLRATVRCPRPLGRGMHTRDRSLSSLQTCCSFVTLISCLVLQEATGDIPPDVPLTSWIIGAIRFIGSPGASRVAIRSIACVERNAEKCEGRRGFSQSLASPLAEEEEPRKGESRRASSPARRCASSQFGTPERRDIFRRVPIRPDARLRRSCDGTSAALSGRLHETSSRMNCFEPFSSHSI